MLVFLREGRSALLSSHLESMNPTLDVGVNGWRAALNGVTPARESQISLENPPPLAAFPPVTAFPCLFGPA